MTGEGNVQGGRAGLGGTDDQEVRQSHASRSSSVDSRDDNPTD